MSAFYKELLGCTEQQARRIDGFMRLAHRHKAVVEPQPWANHGKVRVYFDIWSQNNLLAISPLDRVYYDANLNDVRLTSSYDREGTSIDKFRIMHGRGPYSGAKTREAFKEFAEAFHEQKDTWD